MVVELFRITLDTTDGVTPASAAIAFNVVLPFSFLMYQPLHHFCLTGLCIIIIIRQLLIKSSGKKVIF